MKRRFQFSVATLLVIVTGCAFAAHWYAAERRFEAARRDANRAMWGGGPEPYEDSLYDSSVQLMRAEQAVPFSDHRNACKRHLEFMEHLEESFRSQHKEDVADKIHVWVEEGRRWLGEMW